MSVSKIGQSLLLFTFFITSNLYAPEIDLDARIQKFNNNWYPFMIHFLGCREGVKFNAEDCRPGQGWIDYGRYRKAREAAKVLFELGEK